MEEDVRLSSYTSKQSEKRHSLGMKRNTYCKLDAYLSTIGQLGRSTHLRFLWLGAYKSLKHPSHSVSFPVSFPLTSTNPQYVND